MAHGSMIPRGYAERVYAGVLGKIIGVYLGRPFEQWRYERIMAELGTIEYYVHDKIGVPLVVTDDDISGTFTFVRAAEDYGFTRDLTPAQIGQTWLNYIIENKTILWWGGLGMSTEHTAFLRLQNGIPAPRSGSIEMNGTTVAEQIGSQIFIDGWAMIAPGDPEFAADLARRAASVSHDGEAIYGAQVVAAIESLAFIENDLVKLLNCAQSLIPSSSAIHRVINDLRELRTREDDWRAARAFVYDQWGYEKFPGHCHMVPNHALIIMSLLWCADDFQKAMSIVNTSGYDTDCNAANVGCIMGIKNGLAGINAGPDWRGPVADQILLPSADGGRCITDAVIETFHLVNIGLALAGEPPVVPKNGARFHFDLPGSVQGFRADESADARDLLKIENVAGHSASGSRSLALHFHELATGLQARASTPTFTTVEQIKRTGYGCVASPTIYAGQVISARVVAYENNDHSVGVGIFLKHFGGNDALQKICCDPVELKPGAEHEIEWRIPETGGQPIAEIGVELSSEKVTSGTIYLDYLGWSGAPDVIFKRPADGGTMWQRAWADSMDVQHPWLPFYRIKNSGRGLASQGTREWTDYRVTAEITPLFVTAGGIAARVQGLKRFYALLLSADGKVRLIKSLDGDTVLAEKDFAFVLERKHKLSMEVRGTRIRAWIDDEWFFDVDDESRPLMSGAIGIVCENGLLTHGEVHVQPVDAAF